MRKASLVGFMTAVLLQGCAGNWPPPQTEPADWDPAAVAAPARALPRAAALPPLDGERRVVVEPLRGITKVDLVGGPAVGDKDASKDLWARIRQGFAMPNLDNALVRRRTREYAASSEYLQRMFDRSRL